MSWSEAGPRFARRTLLLAALAACGGCGFHLRGAATLPFNSILIGSQAPLAIELARNVSAASNAKVVIRGESEAVFNLIGEQRERSILSLSTSGQAREYQLRYRVAFSVTGPKGGIYVPASTLILRRDITFNDQVLAKESEEQLLYQDMQTDMVQQILRRMQAARLRYPED